jgi:tRNA (mo5U34)-methyltransferase
MLALSADTEELLPTIYSAFKPVEDYLALLAEAGASASGQLRLEPIDTLAFALFVRLSPVPPTLIDLAGSQTQGTSTVLCSCQRDARKIVAVHGITPDDKAPWSAILRNYLKERCPVTLARCDDKSIADAAKIDVPQLSNGDPSYVLLPATGEAGNDLLDAITHWLERQHHTAVFVLGLKAIGECQQLTPIMSAFGEPSPYRFLLLREQAAALHASQLGVIFRRTDRRVDSILHRIRRLLTGNFSFLNLVQAACDSAIKAVANDEAVLADHPDFGQFVGTRRRIAELETEAARQTQEIQGLANAVAERDQQLADSEQQLQEIQGLASAVAERDQQLADSEQQLAEALRQLSALEHEIAQREPEAARQTQEIQGLASAVAERDQQLADSEQQLAEALGQLSALEHQLAACNQELVLASRELASIHGSLSFGAAQRLQRIRVQLAPEGTARNWLYRKMLGAGRVWRAEGLRGVTKRIVARQPRIAAVPANADNRLPNGNVITGPAPVPTPLPADTTQEREREQACAEYGQLVAAFYANASRMGYEGFADLFWYHTIDLGKGLITPGSFDYRTCLDAFRFPADMSGMSVLDIGSATGFFAFEFERRGAKVVSVELPSYDLDKFPGETAEQTRQKHIELLRYHTNLSPAARERIAADASADEMYRLFIDGPFRFCHRVLNSEVARCYSGIYDLSLEILGKEQFDLIYIGDVLLHTINPLQALAAVAPLCRQTLIISQTMPEPHDAPPAMIYVGGDEAGKDAISWWLPNRLCFEQILRKMGFKHVEVVGMNNGFVRPSGHFYERTVMHARR